MSIKTITAYLDSADTAPQVIDAAVNLGGYFNAHIVALYVKPPLPAPLAMGDPMTLSLAAPYYDQINTEILTKIKTSFEQRLAQGCVLGEWRETDTLYSRHETVAQHALMSDLLIIGTEQDHDSLSRLGSLIALSQRPTMIVPSMHQHQLPGKNMLVAWDGSPESTRAVFGSLPLLKAADKVDIIMINSSVYDQHHFMGSDAELVNSLARHGVQAELSFSACSSTDIAGELLNIALEKGSNAIVMGAFGTGRLHNLLVGSVSQKAIQGTSIPLVMCH